MIHLSIYPFVDYLLFINQAIFRGYVRLPEGSYHGAQVKISSAVAGQFSKQSLVPRWMYPTIAMETMRENDERPLGKFGFPFFWADPFRKGKLLPMKLEASYIESTHKRLVIGDWKHRIAFFSCSS